MTVADALTALKRAMTDAGWIQYRLGWGKPTPGIPGVPVYDFLTAVKIQIDNDRLTRSRRPLNPGATCPETDNGQKQTHPGAD